MNAEHDVLPDSFSCSAWPAQAYEKSAGSLRVATSSIAVSAWPEL